MTLGVARRPSSPVSRGPACSSTHDPSLSSARDVEAMLWDAQTALLSHDHARAREIYLQAVQPPNCSTTAALALFNLGLSGAGAGSASPLLASPPLARGDSNTLRAPKRNVQAMNETAGWLVLGLWWAIRSFPSAQRDRRLASPVASSGEEDEGLVIPRKLKSGTSTAKPSREASTEEAQPSANTSDASSYILETPGLSDGDLSNLAGASAESLLPLLEPLLDVYRLGKIQQHDPPLVSVPEHNLAEHLHPLGSNVWHAGSKVIHKILRLPLANEDPKGKRPLRSSGDAIDRQIAVRMVAHYIAGMTSADHDKATRHFEQVIQAGPCGAPEVDGLMKHSHKRLLAIPCTPLSASASASSTHGPGGGFPFPVVPTRRLRGHPSSASIFSCASSMYSRSRLLNTPVKSEVALVKLSTDDKLLDKPEMYRAKRNARELLKKSTADLSRMTDVEKPTSPSSSGWMPRWSSWLSTGSSGTRTKKERTASPIEEVPRRIPASALTLPLPAPASTPTPLTLEPTPLSKSRSSPVLSAMNPNLAPSLPPLRTHRSSSHLRKPLPFEPRPEDAINATDPALAAAELASTLTKKAVCDVCRETGVNFPNCRKCGLTFCSRPCRVDRTGAGDGNRYAFAALHWLTSLACMWRLGVEKAFDGPYRFAEVEKGAEPGCRYLSDCSSTTS